MDKKPRRSGDHHGDAANRRDDELQIARKQLTINTALLVINALLFFSTAGVSIWQATISRLAVDDARSAVQITVDNFHDENRAYLTTGDPEDHVNFETLSFPIRNTGHVAAKSITASILYTKYVVRGANNTGVAPTQAKGLAGGLSDMEIQPGSVIEQLSKSLTIPGSVIPGDPQPRTLLIMLPQNGPAELAAMGQRILNVSGSISYDSGFAKMDSVDFCYLYDLPKKHWKNCTNRDLVSFR